MQKLCNRGNTRRTIGLAMNTLLRRTEPCVCVRSEDNLSTLKRPDEKHTRRGRSSACRRGIAPRRSRRSRFISRHSRKTWGEEKQPSRLELRQSKVRFANLFSGKRGYRAEDIACLLFSCAHNALVMDWCSAPPWRRRADLHYVEKVCGLWVFHPWSNATWNCTW